MFRLAHVRIRRTGRADRVRQGDRHDVAAGGGGGRRGAGRISRSRGLVSGRSCDGDRWGSHDRWWLKPADERDGTHDQHEHASSTTARRTSGPRGVARGRAIHLVGQEDKGLQCRTRLAQLQCADVRSGEMRCAELGLAEDASRCIQAQTTALVCAERSRSAPALLHKLRQRTSRPPGAHETRTHPSLFNASIE